MKKILFVKLLLLFIVVKNSAAQPFSDIVMFNYQTFSSTYKNDDHQKNKTDDYVLNFFAPKEFKNGNVFLIRLNTEYIHSSIPSSMSHAFAGIALPVGFQAVTKNKKWKTIVIAVPKLASDFKDRISNYDFQMGGIFLQNYVVSERLKLKAGLYYNREAFGNFFVPLAGVDWQATDRIGFYGILPTNYKMEINLKKNKWYTGINFKSLTRSFRLSAEQQHDYVRYDEMQLKVFMDYFIYKKLLVFGEVGYGLGKTPIQYHYDTKTESTDNPLYTPLNNGIIFNVGIAYRLRFDLSK